MKDFYQDDPFFFDDPLPDDSRDTLDCFGDFDKNSTICRKFCMDSIQCAIEHHNNPDIDFLEHFLLNMAVYPARMN